MPLTLTQIFLIFFLLFALSRVYLRYKGGNVSLVGLIFWSSLFGFAIAIILFPILTIAIANRIGIGRGVDAVIYISIILLFYLVFRLYVYIQDLRQEISKIIEKFALKENEKQDEKKSSEN